MGARPPRSLADALARLRQRSAPPTLLARVQECWSAEVGARVSGQALPVGERGGVVTVSCRSAVWSSELTMLSETLVERLNRALPDDCQVRALRFVTRPS
jgi:predicted nucleic acid-binding Zn ribbon protein